MEYTDSLVLDLEEYDFDEAETAEPSSTEAENVTGDMKCQSWYDICENERNEAAAATERTPYEDDEDDGVNVIIDMSPNKEAEREKKRLEKVLACDPYNIRAACDNEICFLRSGSEPNVKNTNEEIVAPYVTEMRLKNEISNLVAASVRSNTCRSVTLLVDNKLVVVPDHVPISDQLAARIWSPDKLYAESKLPYLDLFNSLLIPNTRRSGDTYAVFAAKYNRTTCAFRPNSSETRSTKLVEAAANSFLISTRDTLRETRQSSNTYDDDRNSLSALYQFCDFAAIVVQDNKVIDFAVHGVRSSIIRMLDVHKPRRVYYNARIGDPLYVFVNYKYQPFYTALKDVSRPIKINRNHANFNTMAFCERNDIFCSLCCCLRDVKGFVNDADVPNTIRVPRPLKFISWQPYDPYQKTGRSFLRSRAMTAVARHKRQKLQARRSKLDIYEQQIINSMKESGIGQKVHDRLGPPLRPFLLETNGQPEIVPRRVPSRFPRSAPQRYKSARDSLRDTRRGDFRPLSWFLKRKRQCNDKK